MPDTIKRNKKIFEYLRTQLDRLGITISIAEVFESYVLSLLNASDLINITNKEIDIAILNNDNVLIETLKLIGVMEISKNKEDLDKQLKKKEKARDKPKEKTDFDQILGSIMKVPKEKDDERTIKQR